MSIGNIASELRTKISMESTVVVALIPVPPKADAAVSSKEKTQYKNRKTLILQEVIAGLVHCISGEDNLSFATVCPDGLARMCYPKVAAWIGDYPEHIKIQGLSSGVCFWCEVAKEGLGDWIDRPIDRDSVQYCQLYHERHLMGRATLQTKGVVPVYNPLWELQGPLRAITNLSMLPKPDMLHTILLGLLDHCMGWVTKLLKANGVLVWFDTAFKSSPPYLQYPPITKSFGEVKQWSGKDMRRFASILVSCFYVAARRVSNPPDRLICNQALRAVRHLVSFYMYCQYKSHTQGTLLLMHTALKDFHTEKTVFLPYRATTKTTKAANEIGKQLREVRDEEVQHGQSWAQKKRIYGAHKQVIEDAVTQELADKSDFAFPKMHMPIHFAKIISQFGILSQFDTETSEHSHVQKIKHAWERTNRGANYEEQMLQYNTRHEVFKERDLEAGAMNRKTGEDIALLAEIDLDPDHRVKFRAPHFKRIDRHGLLINTASELHKYIALDCFYDELRLYFRKEPFRFDADHHWLARQCVTVYHSVQVMTQEWGTAKPRPQIIRCTGNKTWQNKAIRRDWIWYKPHNGGKYGAMHGKVPGRLRCMFTITTHIGSVQRLALIETTEPVKNGEPDEHSGMVRVERPAYGTGFTVIHIRQITGAAHLIPDDPVRPAAIHRSWVVNSHIDLETWNKICLYESDSEESGDDHNID
jgi:hypothetical protein